MELDTQRDMTTGQGPKKDMTTERDPKKDKTTEQGPMKDKTMEQEPQKDHTSEPEVSVIVPIYNMESCLPACVKSIAEQGACVREIILVDDGSTDGSRTVCEGLARDDARIRVIAKENGGAATARNAGLAVAQGRWISFVDPDDRLVPDAFEQLLSAADAETEIICADFEMVYHDAANGQTVKKSRFFADEMMASSAEEKMPLYRQLFDTRYGQQRESTVTGIGVPWAKLYRRDFLREHQLAFDPSLRRMQDNMFNLYAFCAARSIRYVHRTVYQYDYGHTDRLLRSFKPAYADTAQAIVLARREALQRTGLEKDERIRRAAFNEALNLYATALKRSVFHPDNQIPFREKAKAADRLKQTDAFAPLFRSGAGKEADGRKNRIFRFLAARGCWRIISTYLER